MFHAPDHLPNPRERRTVRTRFAPAPRGTLRRSVGPPSAMTALGVGGSKPVFTTFGPASVEAVRPGVTGPGKTMVGRKRVEQLVDYPSWVPQVTGPIYGHLTSFGSHCNIRNSMISGDGENLKVHRNSRTTVIYKNPNRIEHQILLFHPPYLPHL